MATLESQISELMGGVTVKDEPADTAPPAEDEPGEIAAADPGPGGDDSLSVLAPGEQDEDTAALPGAEDSPGLKDDVGEDTPAETEFDLTAMAEKAGLSVEELYKVEIPMGQNLPAQTLGSIKDRFQEVLQIDRARESLDVDKREQQNDVMAARQELQGIVTMLGDSISPELIQRAREEQAGTILRERKALFTVLPEWADVDTQQRDLGDIHGLLKGYGYSEAELSQVYDHRLIKFALDASKLFKRERSRMTQAEDSRVVRTAAKPGRKNQRRSKAARKAHLLNKAKGGGRQDKVSAITELMGPQLPS